MEGFEWGVLRHVLDTKLLERVDVDQILLELHFDHSEPVRAAQTRLLHRLQAEAGYELFSRRENWRFSSWMYLPAVGESVRDCHEVGFVKKRQA